MDKTFIVYLPDEGVYAEIVSYGLYASTVKYSKDGMWYEVIILNEEIDFIFSKQEEE